MAARFEHGDPLAEGGDDAHVGEFGLRPRLGDGGKQSVELSVALLVHRVESLVNGVKAGVGLLLRRLDSLVNGIESRVGLLVGGVEAEEALNKSPSVPSAAKAVLQKRERTAALKSRPFKAMPRAEIP